jgi:hypothetical protein
MTRTKALNFSNRQRLPTPKISEEKEGIECRQHAAIALTQTHYSGRTRARRPTTSLYFIAQVFGERLDSPANLVSVIAPRGVQIRVGLCSIRIASHCLRVY